MYRRFAWQGSGAEAAGAHDEVVEHAVRQQPPGGDQRTRPEAGFVAFDRWLTLDLTELSGPTQPR